MYRERCDASAFLHQYHSFSSKMIGRIKHQNIGDVEVLEYGAGPSLMSTISSVTKASEIVLAEHAKNNRKAISQWLNKDSNTFDWSSHFDYVVKELEGQTSSVVVKEREEKVRKVVKAVVHCDVTKDPPMQEHYKQYDVVITSLVAEAVATNLEEVALYLQRIGTLVKPGGTLLYYGVENRVGYFAIYDERFPNVHATAEFIMSVLDGSGFKDLKQVRAK